MGTYRSQRVRPKKTTAASDRATLYPRFMMRRGSISLETLPPKPDPRDPSPTARMPTEETRMSNACTMTGK